jgi:peptide/nickel transport system substrate-binding protein
MGLEAGSDGCRIEINLDYSDQGSPADLHELTQGYLAEVGICVNVSEVTSDEYRERASRNELDLLTWANDGTSGAFIVGVTEQLVPQFGEFFNPGPALHWEAFTKGIDNGVDPVEPPAEVLELVELVEQFQSEPLGSAASDDLGTQIVQIHVDNLWKIGTVGSVPAPTIRRDVLRNVPEFTVHTYDFYWSYPFNPYQWYLTGE